MDDSLPVRHGLLSILRAYSDIEVVGEATNGREAVAMAERLQPNVMLMDAQTPEMDGVEATRQIKKRWPSIKVLFLTVHSSYVEEAMAAGADAHLMKDSGRQELVQTIREMGHRHTGEHHRHTTS